MILIDFPKNKCCHLVASTKEELDDFAAKLGLKLQWFQGKPNRPHYDLWGGFPAKALKYGARQVTTRELIQFLKENYE